jgi:hypothetical protein
MNEPVRVQREDKRQTISQLDYDSEEGEVDKEQRDLFAYIGVCLICVKMAERALQSAIETVLDDEGAKLAEQSEPERKQTLGEFLKKLKRRVKLPLHLKERLYGFLRMRNRLIHEFDFNFSTEMGRKEARLFLSELSVAALAIFALMTAIFQAWALDEHGVDLFEVEAEETRRIIKLMGKQFGSLAREVLAGRNRVRSSRTRVRS